MLLLPMQLLNMGGGGASAAINYPTYIRVSLVPFNSILATLSTTLIPRVVVSIDPSNTIDIDVS